MSDTLRASRGGDDAAIRSARRAADRLAQVECDIGRRGDRMGELVALLQSLLEEFRVNGRGPA